MNVSKSKIRTSALFIALCLAMSLAACGEGNDPNSESANHTPQSPQPENPQNKNNGTTPPQPPGPGPGQGEKRRADKLQEELTKTQQAHSKALEDQERELRAEHKKALEEAKEAHAKQLEEELLRVQREHEKSLAQQARQLEEAKRIALQERRKEHAAILKTQLTEAREAHTRALADQERDLFAAHQAALLRKDTAHARRLDVELSRVQREHAQALAEQRGQLEEAHRTTLGQNQEQNAEVLRTRLAEAQREYTHTLERREQDLQTAHRLAVEEANQKHAEHLAEEILRIQEEHARSLAAQANQLREAHRIAIIQNRETFAAELQNQLEEITKTHRRAMLHLELKNKVEINRAKLEASAVQENLREEIKSNKSVLFQTADVVGSSLIQNLIDHVNSKVLEPREPRMEEIYNHIYEYRKRMDPQEAKESPQFYLEPTEWFGLSYADAVGLVITPAYKDRQKWSEIRETNHTEEFTEGWRQTIEGATEFLDITSLSPPDEGVLKDQLASSIRMAIVNNGLHNEEAARLGRKTPRHLNIRVLFAVIPGLLVNNQDFDHVAMLNQWIEPLKTHLDRPYFDVEISLGKYDATIKTRFAASWNHSKIVASDRDMLFTGGHNLYNSYLNSPDRAMPLGNGTLKGPVHDVSLALEGKDVAIVAHQFADRVWKTMGNRANGEASSNCFSVKFGNDVHDHSHDCKVVGLYHDSNSAATPSPERNTIGVPVISVGRVGKVGRTEEARRQLSDQGILKLIQQTKTAVFLAQQRIKPMHRDVAPGGNQLNRISDPLKFGKNYSDFNSRVMQALGKLILNEKHVFILTSSNQVSISGEGNNGFQSGLEIKDVYDIFERGLAILESDAAIPNSPIREERRKNLLRYYLHFLPTANENQEVPNHSKVVISDGEAAYVGSSNVYDDSHAEFGVIVGRLKAVDLLDKYFKPFWNSSQKYQLSLTKVNVN